jgi:hypothetical protein
MACSVIPTATCAFILAFSADICAGEAGVGISGGGFGVGVGVGMSVSLPMGSAGFLSLSHDLQELNVVSVVLNKANAVSIAIVFFIFACMQESLEERIWLFAGWLFMTTSICSFLFLREGLE